jgi:hypothetical protein
MSSFNKIEEVRTGSVWKRGVRGKKEEVRDRGKNVPNNVCTYE